MYYTSSKYVRIDHYEKSATHICITEVISIYDQPALIIQNNGEIIVYRMATYRANVKQITEYLRSVNRRYGTSLNLRMVQRAYKDTQSIYVPELDFLNIPRPVEDNGI